MPERLAGKAGSRPRGILTDADREYLAGETDLKPQTERRRRQLIRERVFNALFDFWYLVDYLPQTDLDQIFDANQVMTDNDRELPLPYKFLHADSRARRDQQTRAASTAFRAALTDMVAFVVLAAQQVPDLDPAQVIESGMTKELQKRGQLASVQTREAAITYLVDELEAGDLNPIELEYLLDENREELIELLTQQSEEN